jgi:Mn-dependent DtxR family transcriptional regulator
MGVDELTVSEISKALNLKPVTVKKRLQKKGIKPVRYVGITAIYEPTVLELIREVPSRGRPKKKDG